MLPSDNNFVLTSLFIVALLVWGGVVYRLLGSERPNENEEADNKVVAVDSLDSAATEAESFTYIGDFRDPFAPVKKAAPGLTGPSENDTSKLSQPAPDLKPPKLPTLNGVIGRTALVTSMNGSVKLVAVGDSVGSLLLEDIRGQSILVSNGRKQHEISIQ